MSALDEILDRVRGMSVEDKAALAKDALAATRGMQWVPNPGPQTDGYYTDADETFYGGQAGGGKTDLMLGLALNEHKRSLILRRTNKEAEKLPIRLQEIIGNKDGWNGQRSTWTLPDGRTIETGGVQLEDDKQKHKGFPHDLIGWDEVSDFTETQFRFINAWNRSADLKRRCRVVAAGNPPTSPEGLWVFRYWAPWLDPSHPNPAKPGELRWFTTINGVDMEVDGRGPHVIPGEPNPVIARSRTFIPSALSDNPDLAATNYDSVLAALPEELRRAYRDGDFTVGLRDADFQVIPTAWIEAANLRWTSQIPPGVQMTAMGVDVAPGGLDNNVLAWRYGGWYAPLAVWKQPDHDGNAIAGLVVQKRRDNCPVVVDLGGGWGGEALSRLKENGIASLAFNGVNRSTQKTRDGKLSFANLRAEATWRFREALDPEQEGGSVIALPPDPELKADLASYHWKLTGQGILVEPKEDIRKRIGRSPDKGDAVIMALAEGEKAMRRAKYGQGQKPKVNLGHSNAKRRR
jgi:hypothetical protein